ncbi:uncharacterized protein LOC124138082 isoform X3 [Haliotis rufescens]|uniref:uncharacterized protein LOC124138082 isoform X4 n=1 Tax=Haliotis rufescens TaxID=6454 RepID=UPI00201E9648|nr:uncharacterized protein LOC124138082 isoform X4 [Haliotis rufescens]XP_048249238.1 uncharacterized protein LOC124138082 isoform X3 [Haliotis rufescens]
MKFVSGCVAIVLLSSVCGLEWLTRRESEPESDLGCPSTTCDNVYAPIIKITEGPFADLIKDGKLSLDCSDQTLTSVAECQLPSAGCTEIDVMQKLFLIYATFCRNQTEIEEEASCWTSDNLPGALDSCPYGHRRVLAEPAVRVAFGQCIYQSVSSLTECTETSGAIFRQLVLDTLP